MTSALLLLTAQAFAWKHTGFYWPSDEFPLGWYHDPDPAEDSLPEGYPLEVLQISWDNWPEAATCAGLSNEYLGERDEDGLATDGRIWMAWEDPDDIQDAGVLGVTYTSGTGRFTKTANGRTYEEVLDSDIVFNNDVDFGTTADIDSGSCTSETSIESVATHEIGHLHGLGHSCEEEESCTAQDLAEATMFWSASPCDTSGISPNSDDVTSINALYGVFGTFAATTPRSGAAPFDVTFAIESDATVKSATWKFGDETTGEGAPSVTHTYETNGAFSVSVEMVLEDPICGETVYEQTEIAYVLSCTKPIPEDGSDGFFHLELSEGLTWQTVNHTNVTTYGCVDTIQWEVYEGSEVNPDNLVDFDNDDEGDVIGAWAPKISFPKSGTYTVLMNVGGPGGISAGQLTLDVTEAPAASTCSTTEAGSLLVASAAGVAALLRRRRR